MSTEYSKLNGLILPTPLLDEINEASNYFGSSFEQMIFNSIERNLLDKDPEVISALNESFQKVNFIKETLKKNEEYINSIEESDSANIDLSCTFWGKIENSLGKKLNIVIEGASPEQIEGDGEVAQHADKEPQEGQEGQEDQEGQEPQLQPEQVLQMELAQTDNKFATLVTYNKIVEVLKTVESIKENIYSSDTEDELDLYNQLEHYQTYLEILNELIFVMDINTVYYNLTNIIVELNALFDKYLIATKIKVLNSDSNKDSKKEAESTLKDNAESNEDLMDELE
jgi:hypothetical protein